MTWSVSSPSVAGRDGVPTGFAEVAQPVQISQIQQGLIGINCNLPDVTINDQMQKNIMDQDDLKYMSQEMTLSLNPSCGHVKAAVLLGRCLF